MTAKKAAKKSSAKKRAKKAAPARKAPDRKAPAKKSSKAPARKAPAKKAATKKRAPAKKSAAKKAAPKKSSSSSRSSSKRSRSKASQTAYERRNDAARDKGFESYWDERQSRVRAREALAKIGHPDASATDKATLQDVDELATLGRGESARELYYKTRRILEKYEPAPSDSQIWSLIRIFYKPRSRR